MKSDQTLLKSQKLDLPQKWITAYCRETRPDLYDGVICRLSEPIHLSCNIEKKRAEGINFAEISAELSIGFDAFHRPSGGFYEFRTRSCRIFINPKSGETTNNKMATISSIKKNEHIDTCQDLVKADVTFSELWDERQCDISLLMEHINTEKKRRKSDRFTLEDQAMRKFSVSGRQERADKKDYHASVRRQYGNLKELIKIFENRVKIEQAASATGTIIEKIFDSDNPSQQETETDLKEYLTVDISSGISSGSFQDFEDDCLVKITKLADKTSNRRPDVKTKIAYSNQALNHIYLYPQDKIKFQANDKVSIELLPRFAMKQQAIALERLLSEDTVGNWEMLVDLLCDVKSLPPFVIHMPERFFLEEIAKKNILNEQQKQAVAGALSTPHAFFIQGPPGTGKTTVITEIILQLAAKGERVLLLAPTHVAVDEVLRRIGDQPGIFPLRVTWDESRVRQDLRRFTISNVKSAFVRKFSLRGEAKRAAWTDEINQIHNYLANLGTLELALRSQYEINQNEDNLKTAKATWEHAHSKTMLTLNERILNNDVLTHNLNEASEEISKDIARLEDELSVLIKKQGLWDKIKTWLRIGPIAQTRIALAQKTKEKELHSLDISERKSEANQLQHLLQTEIGMNAAKQEDFLANDRLIRQARNKAQSQWEQVVVVISGGMELRLEDIGRLRSKQQDRIKTLESYVKLEKRWVDLLETEDSDTAIRDIGNELLLATNLVCATTEGIAGDRFVGQAAYDTLILDEASRVTDSEFLIGAIQTKRWILVGDEKQLPPYVEQDNEQHLHALLALNMLDEGKSDNIAAAVDSLADAWQEDEELHRFRRDSVRDYASAIMANGYWGREYKSIISRAAKHFGKNTKDINKEILQMMITYLIRSLFERCVESCRDDMKQQLIVQRRMIAPLAEIVRVPVYGGKYESPSEQDLEKLGIVPLVTATFQSPITFLDTSHHVKKWQEDPMGSGFVNKLERDWIVSACFDYERELRAKGENNITVSVLCFYRSQAKEIRSKLGHPDYKKFRSLNFQVIDAIDKIQGQESHLVLISFCRMLRNGAPSKRYGQWLQDIRRLNVACTRARRAIVFVGQKRLLEGLCTFPEAQSFYGNLFQLFKSGDQIARIIYDYKSGSFK